MSLRPAIIAALPREISSIVHGWKHHRLAANVHAYTSDFAVVAYAGMGKHRTTLAVEAARSLQPVTDLVSVGFAGACSPSLTVGDVVRPAVVIDAQTGERFEVPMYRQVLVSSSNVAGIREKRRLQSAYGANAVDMEAATVARLAQAHGLTFNAVKVISDEADFEMTELARFATIDGQFREAAFVLHTVLRPKLWGKLASLAGNARKAGAALNKALQAELKWYQERA